MRTAPKLSIELIWEDVDVEELCITASNGEFCGSARVYFARGDVAGVPEHSDLEPPPRLAQANGSSATERGMIVLKTQIMATSIRKES